MERYVVDRVEEGIAVLEGEDLLHRHVPLEELPPGTREGDCLRLGDGGFYPDPEETAHRRAHNQDLLRRLSGRSSHDPEEAP